MHTVVFTRSGRVVECRQVNSRAGRLLQSGMTFLTAVLLSLAAGAAYLIYRNRKTHRLPPGPPGVPIFGNAFQFSLRNFVTQIAAMGDKYEDAFTVTFFNQKMVVLNSFSLIKETLDSPKYEEIVNDRQPTFLGQFYLQDDVLFAGHSKDRFALRKMMYRGLKTYGTYLREVEVLARQELKGTISKIHEYAGTAVDPYDYISIYVTSIIVMLLTGTHLGHDASLMELCSDVAMGTENLVHPITTMIMINTTWLRWLPFGCWKRFQTLQKQTKTLIDIITEKRKTADRSTCYLDYMMEQKEKGYVDDRAITTSFLDLLIAGLSTTRATMYSCFLILAHKPNIQDKIQQEIDTEIGMDCLPSIEDRQRMPYTQAVLEECFRLYCGVPFPLPRRLAEELQVGKYKLPKHTQVNYNLWNVLHDPSFWQDPYGFNPDRFLDDCGNYLDPSHENRQRMIVFGLGRHACVGENIARVRAFLLLVGVLQNFNIKPHKDFPLQDPDPRGFDVNIVLQPHSYRVIFEPRA